MIAILTSGLFAAALLAAAIVWSIIFPTHRVWPPRRSTTASKIIVWALTLTIFGSAAWLGLADWKALGWPAWLRWGLGAPLIVAENYGVWRGVVEIGLLATSGEATGLKTDGLYSYSRNPQYVADMAILVGWFILSASLLVLPVAMIGILVLAVAPLSEESWLQDVYGDEFREYRAKVRRYI